jgi:hypothetical protein
MQDIRTEIEADLKSHRHWQQHDFNFAQLILWIAIVASTFAAITAAGALPLPKWLAAIVAALPGAVLVIDRTFKHGARSSWHALYAARLRGLNHGLRDRGVSVAEASKQLDELEVEMQKLFPSLDPGLLREKSA